MTAPHSARQAPPGVDVAGLWHRGVCEACRGAAVPVLRAASREGRSVPLCAPCLNRVLRIHINQADAHPLLDFADGAAGRAGVCEAHRPVRTFVWLVTRGRFRGRLLCEDCLMPLSGAAYR